MHRSEFPKHVKTYQKICEVLKFRFDSNTKRETNTKSLQRLDFSTFLKEAGGSTLRAFNAFVLRIERLSAIATIDQQTEKAKITNLMNTIEHLNWYLTATAGVELIPHFTGVVQKINHELGKIATSVPNFDEQQRPRQDSDLHKIKRDILLALGINNEDDSSTSEDSDYNDQERTTDSDENSAATIQFGGQRRYGRPQVVSSVIITRSGINIEDATTEIRDTGTTKSRKLSNNDASTAAAQPVDSAHSRSRRTWKE